MLTTLARRIQHRWHGEGGYREVLVIAIPLIASTGSWAVQHFVDRMFLTWYSPAAIAACVPAGALNFTIMSLFIGTASYVGTFVSQYYGAGRYERIGPAVWQGNYVAAIGGLVLAAVIPLAGPLFDLAGHEQQVRRYEIIYFQILCLGAFPAIASSGMSGFFSGLGKTWIVMLVNILATGVNLVGDYVLIFGKWGFPELGVKGAAIATVLSACFNCAAYLVVLFQRSYLRRYHTLRGWRPESDLFGRLLRFGVPNGVQFCIDVAAFAAFVLFLGRLGQADLAASNIAFNINSLAFMPMFGIGIAVSVLVGQNLGRGRADLAERSTYSGFHLTFLYMGTMSFLYLVVPDLFLAPFAAHANPAEFSTIRQTTVVLLRFVAFYSLFDTMNLVFASAIKGAGDTRYVMGLVTAMSVGIVVIPSYIAFVVLQASVYVGWTIMSVYVIVLGFGFLFRFLGGKWKSMRVIEEVPYVLAPTMPEAPAETKL